MNRRLLKELTDSSFDLQNNMLRIPKVPYHEINIVFIYANWCHHCTKFKPTYSQIANVYSSLMGFYIVDSENPSSKDIVNKYVNSYPTILIFDKNLKLISSYKGNRSLHEFSAYLCRLSRNCAYILK